MERLDAFQKRRMLERAIATIADLREAAGIPRGQAAIFVDIHTTALAHDDAQLRDMFLLSGGMIRDPAIVLYGETKVCLF